MDLLGDLGTTDQLASTRAENAVLQQRVQELTQRVQVLTVENQALLAEVEAYRQEAALPNFSHLALGQQSPPNASMQVDDDDVEDAFVQAGQGVFPRENGVTLQRLHDVANPLTCALSPDDSILVTGGADKQLRFVAWGLYDTPTQPVERVDRGTTQLACPAPVIAVGFALEPSLQGLAVAGCMDGNVCLVDVALQMGGVLEATLVDTKNVVERHPKFVKTVAWSPTRPLLATAAADGSVNLYTVARVGMHELGDVAVTKLTSLHLPGPVEAMVFWEHRLICHARGTPHLSYFDLDDANPTHTKVNLNTASGKGSTGGFDDHVSFTVMDLQLYDNKYLAAATDTSRNMILDVATGRQIRNLYGHQNDGFSQPKVCWSRNGQYLLGNTQDESSLCVWDIASAQLIERLPGHTSPIRDLFSSSSSDTLVTTSFDKQTKLWFAPMGDE